MAPSWADDKTKPTHVGCSMACIHSFKPCYNGLEENDKTCDSSKQACMELCQKTKSISDTKEETKDETKEK